jgi:polysaccharide export outer membrane protein
MPERRRVSLRAIGWAGLLCCLGGGGCNFSLSFGNPEATYPPTPGPDRPPARTGGGGAIVQTGGQTAGPAVTLPGPLSPVPVGPDGQPLAGPTGPGCGPHGCGDGANGGHDPGPGGVPTELNPMSLPPYVIEPPDILLIDTIRIVPRPPYLVSALDVLLIRVAQPLPNQPIEGTYTVAPDGTINLGYSYGIVRVGGLTLEQVELAIRRQVGRVLKDPQVSVGLAQYRGVQLVRGEHLVRMDGTISLGTYGCVYVAGLTLAQAKVAIERYLSQYVLEPEISVDVLAFNSKAYYVITDGAGYGQQVFKLPVTGKDTVLDAISNIRGLPAVASKRKIWVARPAPACHGCLQVLPVDWLAIVEGGATTTNYQLFPGDRVYVKANPLITFDNVLAQVLSPIERVLTAGLLATSISSNLRNNRNGTSTAIVAPIR